jgi:hypothetical protein
MIKEVRREMKKTMKALFFLFFASLIYSETDFILYKNEKFNYKIIVPRAWKKVDLILKDKSIMYTSKDKNTEIKVRAFRSTDQDIDKITHETQWDLQNIDPKLNKIIETKNIEIKKNVVGKLLVFEYRSNKKNILNRVMITQNDIITYIIECRSTIDRFYQYDNIFTIALSSFSFLDKSADNTSEEKKENQDKELEEDEIEEEL